MEKFSVLIFDLLIKNEDSVSAKKLLDKIFVIALKSLKIILLFYIKRVISSALKVKRKVFLKKYLKKLSGQLLKNSCLKATKKSLRIYTWQRQIN